MRPILRGDVSPPKRPRSNGHRGNVDTLGNQRCVDRVRASKVFQELFVIHSETALSYVASRRNMICSAAPSIVSPMDDDVDLESPGGRLKWARKQAGFERAVDFAKRYGYNPTSYRAYENNQNGYSKLAAEFSDRLGVPVRWLMVGGDLEHSDQAEAESALAQQARDMGLSLVPELELGYSMGGGSVFNDYHRRGMVPFQRDWFRGIMRGNFADLFVARGSGDSMTPTLLDGDIVLIDTSQRRIDQQDRIWALSYGDLGMIKRVRRLPGGTYRVMSDNPAVSPIEATDEEMHVVGRVIWIGRTM